MPINSLEQIGGQIRKAPHNNNYDYLNNKIANVFASLTENVVSNMNYIYKINSDPIYLTSTEQEISTFNIDVVNTTHLLMGTMLICNASVPTLVTVNIKYDNTIIATIKNGQQAGYQTIAAPFIIPAASTGYHTIKLIASCDAGTVTLDQNCLNVSLTAQYLNSKMPEIPHAEEQESVFWVDVAQLFFGTTFTIVNTIVDTPIPLPYSINIPPITTGLFNGQLTGVATIVLT